MIDFRRDKDGVPGKVFSIEYDPNRTANIALLHYADGEKRYILAPMGLSVGDTLFSGATVDIRPGNTPPLQNIPIGTVVHNIETKPGRGGQLIRSAGTWGQLMAKEGDYAQVRFPSGMVRKVLIVCRARSASWATLTTKSSASVRRARVAGWASALQCVVGHEPWPTPRWWRGKSGQAITRSPPGARRPRAHHARTSADKLSFRRADRPRQ